MKIEVTENHQRQRQPLFTLFGYRKLPSPRSRRGKIESMMSKQL